MPADDAGVADLSSKKALVTGGAKRIGRAICKELAEAGCHVVVHYSTSEADARELAEALDRRHAIDTGLVQCDLHDVEATEQLIDAASDAIGGPIDLLVNNASSFPPQRWENATYADLDAMMRIHAWAPFALGRALHAQGGMAVVNLTDTRVVADDPAHGPYLLSKQALANLTQEMARRFAPMRVNAVAPGPILPPTGGTDQDFEAARNATVLGRTGSAQGIAHAVRFLLQNEFITGDTVFVDGGRHLRD